jgi:hypothetical protein
MKLKCAHCGRALVYSGQIRKRHLPCPACGSEIDLSEAIGSSPSATKYSSASPPKSARSESPDSRPVPVFRHSAVDQTESHPLGGGSWKENASAPEANRTNSLNEGNSPTDCQPASENGSALAKRLLPQPVAVMGLTAVVLLAIYFAGVILPVLRFALLGSITLAVLGLLFSLANLAVHGFVSNAQPHNERALKNAAVACGAIIFICAVLLFMLPPSAQNPTGALSNPSVGAPSSEKPPIVKSPAETATPKADKVAADVMPPRSSPVEANNSARQPTPDDAAAQLLGALFQAAANEKAAENERRYQEFRGGLDNLSKCPRCGGAGTYRYVDGSGVLRSANCPSCLGSGGSFGSNPLFGNP